MLLAAQASAQANPASLGPNPAAANGPAAAPAANPAITNQVTSQIANQPASTLAAFTQDASGAARLTVQLHPESLGQVQIALVQPKSGPTEVQILAERPATLAALVQDQGQLQAALDRAGVPASGGRVLSFHLAPASPIAPPGGAAANAISLNNQGLAVSPGASGQGAGGFGTGAGATPGGGNPFASATGAGSGSAPAAANGSGSLLAQSGFGAGSQAGPGDGRASQRQSGGTSPGQATAAISGGERIAPAALPSWLRAGLDITA